MKAELDWFEFETRMRLIVTQLIQPLVETLSDHSSNLESLNKSHSSHNVRITNIEHLTGNPDKKTGWILEAEQRMSDLSLEIKLLSSKTFQKFLENEQLLNNTQVALQESNAISESMTKQIELIEKDIETIQNTMHDVNNSLKSHFEAAQDDLTQKLSFLQNQINECSKQAEQSLKKSGEISQKTNENFHHLDKMRLMMREQSMQMIQLVHEKATVEEFLKLTTSVDNRVEGSLEKLRIMENKFQEMVRYLDVYLPFDMQVYISDNLYSFLNKRTLKLWMKFEEQRRKELQKRATDFDTVSQIGKVLENTLNAIKNFEGRKDDIYFKMIRRRVEEGSSDSDEEYNRRKKLGSLTMKHDQKKVQTGNLDKEMIDEILKAKKELSSVLATVKEGKTAQDNLKAFITNEIQEMKVNLNVFQDLWKTTRSEDIEKWMKDLTFNSDRIENYRSKIKDCHDAIFNIAGLVSALTEFSIVITAIINQEEKDKKEVIKQTSEMSLPPVHSRKRSLAHEYLSGRGLITKSPSSQIPSTLRYRNNVYSREELIELIGKVVTKAWSDSSSKIPFTPKKLKKINNQSQKLSSVLNISSSLFKP